MTRREMRVSRKQLAAAAWRRRLDGTVTGLTSLAGARGMCSLVPVTVPRVGPPGMPRCTPDAALW